MLSADVSNLNDLQFVVWEKVNPHSVKRGFNAFAKGINSLPHNPDF